MGQGRWSADPRQPAAPQALQLKHGPSVTGEAALAAALKAAGIGPVTQATTRKIEAYAALVDQPGGQGWASAAEAVVAGVPMSVFALTVFGKEARAYETVLFAVPTVSLRQWGGVRFYLDTFGVSPHVEGLPENFWRQARDAGPAQQAQIVASVLDLTIVRITMATLSAQRQMLGVLQNIGKDLQTEADCRASSGCTFNRGIAPGTATATYGRR